jgi:hypothetical protein
MMRRATIITPEGNSLSKEVDSEEAAFTWFADHVEKATGEHNILTHAMLSSRPAAYVTVWRHARLGYKLEYLEVPVL